MRRFVAALALGASAALYAPAALACPVCAQRQEGPLGTIALGVFIVSPWIIALTVGWYVRRSINSSSQATATPPVGSEE
jgi:hypothetical protein